ncbi:MAG: SRPBCC family protein [Candidatus Angelobacter sp.]
MKNGRWSMTLAGLYGAGALTMYFLDPQRGKRRRTDVKDAFVHSGTQVRKFARRFGRDFEHRVKGVVAETENLFHHEQVSDNVLEQRVRTALGRAVSHPHAIDVSCIDGSVALSGWVRADEMESLNHAVEGIRGVVDVTTFLSTTNRPDYISAVEPQKQRKHLPEFLQANWSPTARVAAGGAGLSLIAYGLLRRESVGAAVGFSGAVLLARSIFNTSLRRMSGVGESAGIGIQKTMHVAASAADMYEFWVNPENYPKVFTHVKEVTHEGDGVYRWHVMGPLGIPISWTGTITSRVPGKMVEWKSERGSVIENHGIIRLDAEEDGRTRVHIQMSYTPPAGLLGHGVAAVLGVDPKSLMDHDLVQLKAVFEQGGTRVRGHEVKARELKVAHSPAS